ncbi:MULTISPECIES: hypothetical protein [Mesobacillus]|jgi:hypothetical protein|uniref:hypothetical protein n=1 Tax=Mesobacillus TaxID=2675231 RepID=UPI00177FD975|nr:MULTISPECIES: hypothetical protein [Mesobacillus]MCM3573790.1 hypothetical protein [Mesobacillus subterraneus]UYZ24524.1 hypothetical protein FOF60_15300 [Mesobacillus jeotgali]
MTILLTGKLKIALPKLKEKILFTSYIKNEREGDEAMGKKHRNRINSPKKNNHIPPEAIVAEQEAHGKEFSATGRKKQG